MKRHFALVLLSVASHYSASAFVLPQEPILHVHLPVFEQNLHVLTLARPAAKTRLFMSTTPDPEKMKQILEEEAKNPENMKASAQMLKNLKPDDIDSMLKEMDNMPAAQKQQLQAMGMNPDMMRQSIEMMKSNPQMAKQMANMMESMTPDEMMEKSRQAQANFASFGTTMSPSSPSPSPTVVEAEIIVDDKLDKEKIDDDDDDDDEESEPIPPPDAEILDTLYRTSELMSYPPDGKVTRQGFSSIPPIALLIGDDAEEDLSLQDLRECWADASLGATRVDRVGFERLWVEVQDYFWEPIMDKARVRAAEQPNKKRGGDKPKTDSTPIPAVTQPSSFSGPQVGQTVSPVELEKQVKNMSDTDMDMMLNQMNDLTPEQEARMKSMGVDPEMMRKTASVMNNNPLMKNAAKMMMKNMSADQMMKASQQAQKQMSTMSPDEMQKAMDELEKRAK